MPERHFDIQWPNGEQQSYYSPSSTISNYLIAGQTYPLKKFIHQAEIGLNEASERVRAKYGYACSSAMDQLYQLKKTAAQFDQVLDALVVVKRIY
ncbi:MAG: putative repeat protein (TIGR04042 family) [Oleispira sp.]|jgi:uncharacterized repeat protein (TIGR04042 family)